MQFANPSKALILLVFLTSLTACADRERLNCPPTKNKALRSVTEQLVPTTPAPRYGTGGKCT
jgi:predicted small lipoprotein YifL